MNEFKFSCPQCQQNIQATPEYAGMEINCPACQAAMVVPQPPESAAPQRPGGSKLSKAPSTVQHAATSPVMATTIVRQAKKPRIGLYVGLGVGAVAIVAGIYFGPGLLDKYHEHKEKVLAAEVAATNVPPPPPPEPTAEQILEKIDTTYKGLSSYSVKVESIGTIDMSQVNPQMKAPMHMTTKLSMLLGRPGRYRMEWDREAGPQTSKGAVWSAGKGDFVHTGNSTKKVKDRDTAMGTAGAMSGTMGVGLAELFFNETNNLASMLKNYSKKTSETIDGHKCYVLSGQAGRQDVVFWVRKDDFLVVEAEVVMGGKIDTSGMKLTPAQKAQIEAASKIKGNIMETYTDIETNKVLSDDDFLAASEPNATPKPKASKGKTGGSARAKLQ